MSAVVRHYFKQLTLNGTRLTYSKQLVHIVSSIKPNNYQSVLPVSLGLGILAKSSPALLLKGDCRDSRPMRRLIHVLRNLGLNLLVREKHTSKKSDRLDSSDDEEEEIQQENDGSGKDSRIVKVKCNSLRTDLLVKAGLGIARNKVEALFYESKIRVNGDKIFKKSTQVKVGDEIDVIRGSSPLNSDFILVSRIEIVLVNEREDRTLNVQLRLFKALTIENYTDQWKGT